MEAKIIDIKLIRNNASAIIPNSALDENQTSFFIDTLVEIIIKHYNDLKLENNLTETELGYTAIELGISEFKESLYVKNLLKTHIIDDAFFQHIENYFKYD